MECRLHSTSRELIADCELFSYADADTARLSVEEAQSIIAEATSYLERLSGS